MNSLKRILGVVVVVMALVMNFSMSTMADAEQTGTIILQNNKTETNVSIDGKKYSAFRIFDLVQNKEHTAYAYTLNENFKGLFESVNKAFDESINESKTSEIYNFVSELKNAEDIEKFANVVYDFIQENGIEATKTATAAEEQAVFNELKLGYYILYGSGTSVDGKDVVTACSLDTTTWNDQDGKYSIIIDVKVGAPTVDKNIVQNKGDEKLVKADSVSIGDTVDFRVTSKVPDLTGYTAYTFVMTDKMSKGLTFNNDIVVKIGEDTIEEKGNYKVESETNDDTGITTITVTFTNFYEFIKDNKYEKGTEITFDYSAKLNEKAVIGGEGNLNTAKITYSNDPHTNMTNDTADSTVKVYTFQFNIFKFTGENKPLAGAQFTLKKEGGDKEISFVKVLDGNYRVALEGEENKTTTVESDKNGNIIIKGLGAEEYVLTETKAPDGYNLLEAVVNVKIAPEYGEDDKMTLKKLTDPDANAAYVNLEDNSGIKSDIENTTGSELPSTGGMGTTILYIIGGLLIAMALIGVITKKIAKKED